MEQLLKNQLLQPYIKKFLDILEPPVAARVYESLMYVHNRKGDVKEKPSKPNHTHGCTTGGSGTNQTAAPQPTRQYAPGNLASPPSNGQLNAANGYDTEPIEFIYYSLWESFSKIFLKFGFSFFVCFFFFCLFVVFFSV